MHGCQASGVTLCPSIGGRCKRHTSWWQLRHWYCRPSAVVRLQWKSALGLATYAQHLTFRPTPLQRYCSCGMLCGSSAQHLGSPAV